MNIAKDIALLLSVILVFIMSDNFARIYTDYTFTFDKVANPSPEDYASAYHKAKTNVQIGFAAFCFLLTTVPLLLAFFFKEVDLVKPAQVVVALEIIGLAIALTFTPPGLQSKLMAIGLWQIVVLLNGWIIYRKQMKMAQS